MGKKAKIILPAVSGLVLISLYHYVFFPAIQHPLYYFQAILYLLFILSISCIAFLKPRKILFGFLIWSVIKIVFSGLFLAAFIYYSKKTDKAFLLPVIIDFLGMYSIGIIFEVWFLNKLVQMAFGQTRLIKN